MPWRRRTDAYGIWLSEVMLQQTRVAAVIPYYQRFLQRFPDVFALAEAPLDDVLTAWSGLGYYRRARLLHAGAKHVAEELGGSFPAEVGQLQKIPGIGAYTSGAIASIAFGTPAPVVDGNVERVLCRLVAQQQDPRRSPGKRALWSLAERLVDPAAAGDFNQALMELGATVCTPKSPLCGACPWQSACAAFAAGQPTDYPKLGPRTEAKPHRLVYLVLLTADPLQVYLVQRPERGRFAGLWEPPSREGAGVTGAALSTARKLGAELGLNSLRVRAAGELEHVLTHLRIVASVFVARLPAPRPIPVLAPFTDGRFCSLDAARGESRLAVRALELALAACDLHRGEHGR